MSHVLVALTDGQPDKDAFESWLQLLLDFEGLTPRM